MAIYYTPKLVSIIDMAALKQAIIAEPANTASDTATAITAVCAILKRYLMQATA